MTDQSPINELKPISTKRESINLAISRIHKRTKKNKLIRLSTETSYFNSNQRQMSLRNLQKLRRLRSNPTALNTASAEIQISQLKLSDEITQFLDGFLIKFKEPTPASTEVAAVTADANKNETISTTTVTTTTTTTSTTTTIATSTSSVSQTSTEDATHDNKEDSINNQAFHTLGERRRSNTEQSRLHKASIETMHSVSSDSSDGTVIYDKRHSLTELSSLSDIEESKYSSHSPNGNKTQTLLEEEFSIVTKSE